MGCGVVLAAVVDVHVVVVVAVVVPMGEEPTCGLLSSVADLGLVGFGGVVVGDLIGGLAVGVGGEDLAVAAGSGWTEPKMEQVVCCPRSC